MSSLSVLFQQALSAASTASNLPAANGQTQTLLAHAQSLLREVLSRVSTLDLFSPNELLEDIPTPNLIYLSPPFVLAEVVSRLTTDGKDQRIDRIVEIQRYDRSFIDSLELYGIVSGADKSLHSNRASAIGDPSKRREHKIAQYKQEKDLRSKINAIRNRRSTKVTESSSLTDLDLIAALIQSSKSNDDDDDEDEDVDEVMRETTCLLLRLLYAQAHTQLENSEQELDLIRHAPPSPPQRPQRESSTDEKDTWRLNALGQQGGPDGRGPLLDTSGKLLRPFTILPTGSAAQRARLQAQVFGPDHRLPSMSVDEYLELERKRGKMLTGGGQQSQEGLTTSDKLTLDSEMDGSTSAEERREEKRQKDESWAMYTDTHPKGAGNTMSRG